MRQKSSRKNLPAWLLICIFDSLLGKYLPPGPEGTLCYGLAGGPNRAGPPPFRKELTSYPTRPCSGKYRRLTFFLQQRSLYSSGLRKRSLPEYTALLGMVLSVTQPVSFVPKRFKKLLRHLLRDVRPSCLFDGKTIGIVPIPYIEFLKRKGVVVLKQNDQLRIVKCFKFHSRNLLTKKQRPARLRDLIGDFGQNFRQFQCRTPPPALPWSRRS